MASNHDSLTVGPHGRVLLEDYRLIEKLAHQTRERVPERAVNAKGWGAHGTLTIMGDITRYTRAKIFVQAGKRTICWLASPRWRASTGRRTPSATCGASRSSFTLRRATGTSWATTRPCSSSPTPTSSPDPSTRRNATRAPALGHRHVRLLVALPGVAAPGHHPDVRPRHPGRPQPHERLRQPHVLALKREGRAVLGQVPLQDSPGPRAPHRRRGGDRHRQ